jgi:hypothetical protein
MSIGQRCFSQNRIWDREKAGTLGTDTEKFSEQRLHKGHKGRRDSIVDLVNQALAAVRE